MSRYTRVSEGERMREINAPGWLEFQQRRMARWHGRRLEGETPFFWWRGSWWMVEGSC